jgi:hypothetical protein
LPTVFQFCVISRRLLHYFTGNNKTILIKSNLKYYVIFFIVLVVFDSLFNEALCIYLSRLTEENRRKHQ